MTEQQQRMQVKVLPVLKGVTGTEIILRCMHRSLLKMKIAQQNRSLWKLWNEHTDLQLLFLKPLPMMYFTIGRMIAVSLIHGGPVPQFLSRNLVNYIVGTGEISPSIEDISDPDIYKVLQKIKMACCHNLLRNTIEENGRMLLIAGYFNQVKEVDEREKLVQDYLEWYFFTRNSQYIVRFKDGLSTLNLLEKLKQYPGVFVNCMCFSQSKINAEATENIFKINFSEAGNSWRHEEGRTAVYWADYLLDIEASDKTSTCDPSLEDILMFATGLHAIPPLGLQARPTICFRHDGSLLPVANTCDKILILPIHKTYDNFRFYVSFGILNSPGFGQY
ncbi:G2/M phase-specific E3 ubiquitin-protein ligase-like [Polypterus senegalus]|uniref:G2/M phase-specific E3 ubiquitin-protein ligase-like n=1 Tax=Polypterus senegalus TaxID=55291 RepID=UPI001965E104|nr:G2/M phase-specific E3 ubiquitin-protein ligase-like [Polypterus senegalus]XP_039600858.1 G2/M phase-specific E3 ubiquitin-protein ligase-like [Polypterus senegalus]XP_039600859.1 G2/M phase-specific E3 ubiquitin-protein ligase-like [Polypterus senegalus]XP_039600860.1 G2/M phase-specific E3 ubiquitin-protein ligase-like [Polypterus senegalus]